MLHKMHGLKILTILVAGMAASYAMAQDGEPTSGLWPRQDMLGSESADDVQRAMEHGAAMRGLVQPQRSVRSIKKGALSGKRISLSPGHGIQRTNGTGSAALPSICAKTNILTNGCTIMCAPCSNAQALKPL